MMSEVSSLKQLAHFKNISKNLNVLYVEDNINVRKITSRIFEKFFDKLTICNNGQDGLEEYYHAQDEEPFDIIITDIDMPILNGIEMVKKIREENSKIVVIVTSAKTDTNFLLDAIKLHVDLFLTKPIDINSFSNFMLNLCKLKIKEIELQNQEKETKKFVEILNKIAIVSKTDLKGVITYVNDNFVDISGYSKEELLNSSHNIIRHPDVPKEVFEDLWNTIKNDEVWEGEIKNRKKDGSYYWVKSIISPILENNIKTGYLAVRQDITNKKILEEVSITDELTQIFNRRYFNEVFPKELNISKRHNELLNFVILDVDYFKMYNDTYGHAMGDEVLKSVARAIKNSLKRANDYCFRIGGEEFALIFYSESVDKSLKFCDILKQNIENLEIEHEKNSASKYITASFGLCVLENKDCNDIKRIFNNADKMLYEAKSNGRNCIAHYIQD